MKTIHSKNQAATCRMPFFSPRFDFVLLSILLVLLFASLKSKAQTVYDIVYNGNVYGEMIVDSNHVDGVTYISIKAKAGISFIKEFKILEEMYVSYACDTMQRSVSRMSLNGTVKRNNYTSRKSNGYVTVQNKKNTKQINYGIRFSVARMYFREPVGLSQVYSESYLTFVPVRKTGEGIYKLTLPGNNETVFYYLNGKCVMVKASSGLMKFQMVLSQDNNGMIPARGMTYSQKSKSIIN